MPTLFDPLQIGDLTLPNRIVMAPLTRLRAAEPEHVPNAVMAEYYAQRASAGLLISEGVPISEDGVGYQNVPGLWSDAQVAGWKQVTDAVHAAGGRIVAQLWHVGRISDPSLLNGRLPVAPSAIAAGGNVSLLRPQRPFVVPRELTREEIRAVVADFGRAAANAKAAGFDGVTIHAANGYLLDQFLQDGSNSADDEYGGSIENRARIVLEVADAVTAVWDAPSAWACTWRRVRRAIRWPKASRRRPSAMWHGRWASAELGLPVRAGDAGRRCAAATAEARLRRGDHRQRWLRPGGRHGRAGDGRCRRRGVRPRIYRQSGSGGTGCGWAPT